MGPAVPRNSPVTGAQICPRHPADSWGGTCLLAQAQVETQVAQVETISLLAGFPPFGVRAVATQGTIIVIMFLSCSCHICRSVYQPGPTIVPNELK